MIAASRSRVRVGAVACALLLLAGACSGRTRDSGAGRGAGRAVRHHVVMRGVAFVPASLAAAVGDTVEWDNHDLVPHTTTAVTREWDSGTIAPDSVWSTVIGHPGVTSYGCTFHPQMKGRIVAR